MTPAELINDLRDRGVSFSALDGRLRLEAPIGVVTAEMRALLATHKAAIVHLLTPPAPADRAIRMACWREGRRLGFPLVGRDGWTSFASTAPIEQVTETLEYTTGIHGPPLRTGKSGETA